MVEIKALKNEIKSLNEKNNQCKLVQLLETVISTRLNFSGGKVG